MRLCERFGIDPCVLHVHASQLYEGPARRSAAVRHPVDLHRRGRGRGLRRPGCFCFATACSVCIVEFVRVPDENRGYLLFDWVTMGQILSTADDRGRLVLLAIAYRRNEPQRQSAIADDVTMQQYLDLLRHIRERGIRKNRPHRHRHAVRVRPPDALRSRAGLPAADDQEAAPASRSCTSCCGS